MNKYKKYILKNYMWLTSKQFRNKYKISSQQLYQLKKSGKIETKPYIGNSYLVKDINSPDIQNIAIYARVSTPKQKKDLENQIDFLKKYCVMNGDNPVFIFSDIGSGMNESRKGLSDMLDKVIEGTLSKIVISHKDRLTRFGFSYIENICNKYGTEIEIVNLDDDKSFQDELTEDLIAIIHHFSMRFYGKRKNSCKQLEESVKNFRNNEDK